MERSGKPWYVSRPRIELTAADVRQLSIAWLAQGRPAPTPAELQSLVEGRIREEVLYREALALGLDAGDTIVRRRLAQKMEFLAEDTAEIPEPTGADLRAFFDAHTGRFERPARASFRHLYFSPDRRGARAQSDAQTARDALDAAGADAPAPNADPFMFHDHYRDRSADQIAAVFGTDFADEFVRMKPGAWQGPIRSGYGWHLVWLDDVEAARVPDYETVEPEVRAAWIADRRAQVRDRSFAAMLSRYEIVVPDAAAVPRGPVDRTAAR